MSKTKKENVNIISIPEDALTTLEIGGTFYQRLNKLLIDFGDSVSKDKLTGAMLLIKKNRSHKDHFAFNLETLIILLRDLENKFKEDGLTVDNDVEIDLLDLPDEPSSEKPKD